MEEISKKVEESRSYYIWPPRGVNMRLFCRAVQKKKLLGQMSSKIEEIMHTEFVYCMKLIFKEFMLNK